MSNAIARRESLYGHSTGKPRWQQDSKNPRSGATDVFGLQAWDRNATLLTLFNLLKVIGFAEADSVYTAA